MPATSRACLCFVHCCAYLDVSGHETPEQYKKAFRKAALANHPDRTAGDLAKIEKFKLATAAFRALEDATFDARRFPRCLDEPRVKTDFTRHWEAATADYSNVTVHWGTDDWTPKWTDDARTRFVWELWMVQQGWRLSRNANLWQRMDDGYAVTVFQYKNGSWAGLWGWVIANGQTKRFCSWPYTTQREAADEALRTYRDEYKAVAWSW